MQKLFIVYGCLGLIFGFSCANTMNPNTTTSVPSGSESPNQVIENDGAADAMFDQQTQQHNCSPPVALNNNTYIYEQCGEVDYSVSCVEGPTGTSSSSGASIAAGAGYYVCQHLNTTNNSQGLPNSFMLVNYVACAVENAQELLELCLFPVN